MQATYQAYAIRDWETGDRGNQAVQLYETSGYQRATGVETARCDRIYVKNLTELQLSLSLKV